MKPATKYRFDSSRVVVTPDGETAAWNQLMPTGRWFRPDFPKGGIDISASMLKTLVENWVRAGKPSLPVDYNHEEEGPASGWIQQLELRDDGLWGLVSWTEKARAAIKSDELRYLSPTFALQSMDRRTGQPQGPWLFGAGLLNDPFFDSMPRVAASRLPHSTHEETDMNKKMICDALGLPESCTDEEMVASIAALKQAKQMASASAGDVEKLKASASATEEKLKASMLRVGELEAKLEASAKAADAVKLKAGLDKLVNERRITAAQAEKDAPEYAAAVGVEKALAFFASFPPRGAVGEQGVETKGNEEKPVEEVAEERRALLDKLQAEGKSVDAAFRLASKQRPDLFPPMPVQRAAPAKAS